MDIVNKYMIAWQQNKLDAFLELLSPDIRAVESDGATYHGIEECRQWFTDWHDKNKVESWTLTELNQVGDHYFASWTFNYIDNHTPGVFDGMTTYSVENGKITALTEYQLAYWRFRPYESNGKKKRRVAN